MNREDRSGEAKRDASVRIDDVDELYFIEESLKQLIYDRGIYPNEKPEEIEILPFK